MTTAVLITILYTRLFVAGTSFLQVFSTYGQKRGDAVLRTIVCYERLTTAIFDRKNSFSIGNFKTWKLECCSNVMWCAQPKRRLVLLHTLVSKELAIQIVVNRTMSIYWVSLGDGLISVRYIRHKMCYFLC